ncbi:MAG: alcohol dehydrogenase catalytic domain-containing protein [Oscillibacter sp.]|nr:alcohol dehydrogenase catalytic domain-containing protein [Oscillibacter sp.]
MCYGATCAGTDIHLIDGLHPHPVSYPTILGHESVGRVVKVGAKVRNFHPGDLVSRVGCPACVQPGLDANWGGFAEYGIAKDHWQMKKDGVPQQEWERHRVNQVIWPEIDERTAPMVITWRETLSYIRRLGVRAETRLLLIGSGANALSFAAHACNLGAQVTVVGSLNRRSSFCRLPIIQYADYREEHLAEKLRDLSGGQQFDVMLDGVGGSDTVNLLLPLLSADAVLGVYGWNDRKNYALNPFLAVSSFRIYADGYDEEESNGEVQAMILRGQLRADLWYDMAHPVALDHIASAYDSLRRHEAFKYLIEL